MEKPSGLSSPEVLGVAELEAVEQGARAAYEAKYAAALAAMKAANPDMSDLGLERHLEALERVPSGHVYFGTWNEELYAMGLRPTATGDSVAIGQAHDSLGQPIEGHINLAIKPN